MLSALARRVETEGFIPPVADLAALLDLGLGEAEIAAALGATEAPAAREALEVLRSAAELPRRPRAARR